MLNFNKNLDWLATLSLLQLASPALPVGAYSYSEGVETLVAEGQVVDESSLQQWLEQELRYGAIQLEAAIMIRAYKAASSELDQLIHWNHWLSAFRESEELRQQSWQMGRSLLRLLQDLKLLEPRLFTVLEKEPCNFAIAFALAANAWQIDLESAVLAYLHSWATNLISAGVKLIPLGQTAGQRLLMTLQPAISNTTQDILNLADHELKSCGWGLTLASMAHETQYSRLFRS